MAADGPATLAEAIAVGEKYEYEDPAEAWIDLVTATREPDAAARKRAVAACLFKAKNSHWTKDLWTELCQDLQDVEYGGDWGWQDHEEGSEADDDSSDASMEQGAVELGTLVDSQWE